ncbi:hypothetical protein VTJ49DRAFT_1919 [Mycothermus thermophilus]|uniref:MT-A70-domain-containing protein n=1 Tax=Humicola insolens TaxID=85995 RepID=A0ABR3VB38_HUMIN
MAPPSSILWQNKTKTVVLMDVPRSIEEAQVLSSELKEAHDTGTRVTCRLRRLISSPPPQSPFPTPEPKTSGSGPPTAPAAAQVAELMTRAAVESALDEIATSYSGPWCLPRVTAPVPAWPSPTEVDATDHDVNDSTPADPLTPSYSQEKSQHHHSSDNLLLPPLSHPLQASILPSRELFLASTNPGQFHLILLDPPWPNRSARRKHRHRHDRASAGPSNTNSSAAARGSYRPAGDLPALRSLLSAIPIASRLAPGGLVAVWLTNSPRCAELLTGGTGSSSASSGGLFAEWGVEPVGEWIWVKVTARGEPVVSVESCWRRPWERLIIARRKGLDPSGAGAVKGKVIVSVPDVHSRKPNLKRLFEEEGLLPERYEALEVFARNLTAGWWAWGDEVLKFQWRDWWMDANDDDGVREDDGGDAAAVAAAAAEERATG